MGLDSDRRILVVGIGLRMLPVAWAARGSTALPAPPAALLVGAASLSARPGAKPNSDTDSTTTRKYSHADAKTSGWLNADTHADDNTESFHRTTCRNLTGANSESKQWDSSGRFARRKLNRTRKTHQNDAIERERLRVDYKIRRQNRIAEITRTADTYGDEH